MRVRLFCQCFLSYGVSRHMGKALALILWLTVPAQAGDEAAPVTVLALGDSLTQGYGLPQEDGLVPELRRWLAGRDIVAEIVNGGVSGDTTAGGAARVGWSLTPEVDAMIVALGGNDLLRGIDPGVSRANLDVIHPALAEKYDVLLAPDFFAGLGEGDPAALQRFFQPDGIHPNADGVERIVEGLGQHVAALIGATENAGSK